MMERYKSLQNEALTVNANRNFSLLVIPTLTKGARESVGKVSDLIINTHSIIIAITMLNWIAINNILNHEAITANINYYID